MKEGNGRVFRAKQVVRGDPVQGGVAEIVDHDEVVAQEALDQFANGVVGQPAVERLDELVGLKEADAVSSGDRSTSQGLGKLALADAGGAGEAEVVITLEPFQ